MDGLAGQVYVAGVATRTGCDDEEAAELQPYQAGALRAG